MEEIFTFEKILQEILALQSSKFKFKNDNLYLPLILLQSVTFRMFICLQTYKNIMNNKFTNMF